MPLLSLWKSNPSAVAQLSVEQIVATAGDGKLLDNSTCSHELRQFLTEVPSEHLGSYAEHCLASAFQRSGFVLQDIVNELGRRLDYSVENGRYQGTTSGVGFDGLWHSPEGKDLVVEVKTTDAYRIPLETLAAYRTKLRALGKVGETASVLIIVGREDTGELEAQVRGSRHAWDMRLISVDALRALVALKESTEAGVTGSKIRSILVPMEFTRLDTLVDVLFATAKDVEATLDSEKPEAEPATDHSEGASGGWQFTDPTALRAKRGQIVQAVAKLNGKPLIKRSQALYWDSTHAFRVACTVSKRYLNQGTTRYWYAYHPRWDEHLGEAGQLVLGCMGLDKAFAIPVQVVRAHLSELNTTTKEDGSEYWHVKLIEPQLGIYALQLPKTGSSLPLAKYEVNVEGSL